MERRKYLRQLVHQMHCAKETGNRSRLAELREQFRIAWRARHGADAIKLRGNNVIRFSPSMPRV